MKAQKLLVTLAVALCCAATAIGDITKPLAVWNGDFVANATRNETYKFKVYANGNTISDGIVTIAASSSGGFVVEDSSYTGAVGTYNSTPLMMVAGLSDIPTTSGYTNVLLSAGWVVWNSSSYYRNRIGFMLNENGLYRSFWNNGSAATPGNLEYDTSSTSYEASVSGIDYMALVYGGSGDTSVATKLYINGTETYSPAGLRSDKDNGWRSVAIGGFYNVNGSSNYNAVGMKIKYLALLDSSSTDDVAYWSLTDMTSAENASSSITGGESVGVNLSGGTVSVAANTTAQAVFVQDDTTLAITPSSTAAASLAITKPLYIADGKTLTIAPSSLPDTDGTYPLVTCGNMFGDIAFDVSSLTIPSGKMLAFSYADSAISLIYGDTLETTAASDTTYVLEPFSSELVLTLTNSSESTTNMVVDATAVTGPVRVYADVDNVSFTKPTAKKLKDAVYYEKDGCYRLSEYPFIINLR